MQKQKIILITRPAGEAEDYAAALRALGYETFTEPMLEIRPLPFVAPAPGSYQGLIFTSTNGVRIFAPRAAGFKTMPAFCVGRRTAEEARQQGFENVASAEGDSEDLADLVKKKAGNAEKPFLYVRGEDTARPISQMMAGRGLKAESLVVYSASPVISLSASCAGLIKSRQVEAVTFFSRRTARNFAGLCEKQGLSDYLESIKLLSISAAVLESVRSYVWASAYAASTPDREGMDRLLRRHCPQNPRKPEVMNRNEQQIENAEIIIQRFGGIRPMASKMSVPVTTVQGWKKRNAIPANRLEEIIRAAREHNVDISDIAALSANENVAAPPAATGDRAPAIHGAPPEISRERLSAVPRSGGASMPGVVYEDLNKKLSRAEEKAVRKSAMINAVFVILAAAAVIGLLWPQSKTVTQNQKRLEALEQDIAALERDMAKVRKNTAAASAPSANIPSLGDIRREAARLPGQAQAVANESQAMIQDVFGPDAGNLGQRAANFQGHLENMAGSPTLAGILERYQDWQNDPAGRDRISQFSYGLYNTVTGFQGPPEELDGTLDDARTRNPSLTKVFEGVPPGDLKAAAMLLAMAEFRSSLNRDNVPFEQDLQILKSLAGKDDPALIEALDRLAPHAQEGVLTPEGLTNEFKTITGDVVAASLSGKEVSVQERAAARFNQIFQVKKDGELITGTPTQERVAKADEYLQGGNLESAIAEMQKLEGPAAAAAASWISKAQATLSAQQFKNMLTGNINQRAYGSGAVSSATGVHNPVAGASVMKSSPFGDNTPKNPYATP